VTPALTFLGAAGTVTGAKFLLETGGPRLLLECGMFQGLRELRERNWQPPPVEPRALDAVLLSHAHIDHSGYLPRLARDGFAGPVYCSPGTADLLRIMLPDAARLQEEEAEYRNLKGATKHEPALPLFTVDDAERALALVRPVAFGQRFAPVEGVEASFHPAGHILGASIVEVAVAGHRLVYSGDLGRYDVPIMRDPEPVEGAGTLLVESTYGDRLHPAGDGSPVIADWSTAECPAATRPSRATRSPGSTTIVSPTAIDSTGTRVSLPPLRTSESRGASASRHEPERVREFGCARLRERPRVCGEQVRDAAPTAPARASAPEGASAVAGRAVEDGIGLGAAAAGQELLLLAERALAGRAGEQLEERGRGPPGHALPSAPSLKFYLLQALHAPRDRRVRAEQLREPVVAEGVGYPQVPGARRAAERAWKLRSAARSRKNVRRKACF